MLTSTSLKSLAFVSALALSGVASAATLYDQPYDNSGTAYSSQNDTGSNDFGNFATVYDNFTLGGSATVTGVGFTGIYFNPPEVGNITAFTLQFYADSAGQPGSSIYSTTVSGNGGESCAGATCTYNVAVNFAAAGGTKYWLSIVPDVAFPPQWGWAEGTGGDTASFQDFFGNRSPLAADLAFTLTGDNAVPEPATWAMMIAGFGLAGAAMRRRSSVLATA